MNLKDYIQTIQIHLIDTHNEVLKWFNLGTDLKQYKPLDNSWSIAEILEHIGLTSHFLLILIDKGSDKAIRNIKEESIDEILKNEELNLNRIERIGMHKSFDWIRPEHMEPTGQKSDLEIKNQIISQLNRCLTQLELLCNGEGLRYRTTMTVDGLGKINVYEYIYFLSQHAKRHIQQMEENKVEMESRTANNR